MLSSESGYPLQWFVDRHSVDDYLKCGICGNVLRDPRTTNCGHVFCLSCLLGWIDVYGICPQRCGEVEADQMKRPLHIEKRISGLLTLCKYQHFGCTVQVPLADKALHESTCPYRPKPKLTKALSNQFQLGRSTVESKKSSKEQASQPPYKVHHKRTRSSGSGLGHHNAAVQLTTKSGATTKRSPSLCTNRTCQIQHLQQQQQRIPTGMNHRQTAAMQGTTHSFRLKRTRAKEPLGLVLVCGEKTPEGKPLSFYVKKVNPDTLGWRAGIEAGDRIVQVDYYDLARIDPQEAVARIKDKPVVALTVLRGFPKPTHLNRSKSDQEAQHIYDEIMYADALSQQDENLPPVISAGVSALNARSKHRIPMMEDAPNRSSKAAHKRPVSPAGNTFFRTSSGPPAPKHQSHSNRSHQSHRSHHHHQYHHPHQTRHLPAGEGKGSKDSGLSSGSSGTGGRHHHALQHDVVGQPQHVVGDMQAFERSIYEGRSNFRTEQDVARKYLFDNGSSDGKRMSDDGSTTAEQLVAGKNCRIDGEYEVEEIYLEKSGTSQLGITLGYDTQSAKGHLYVCEVLPTGLAAQDGRLHCGDIIRRVNGFEVYDPEEAVLLFLEQDQDITLTVARKIKAPPSHQRLQTSPPRDFSFSQPEGEHSYAVLEGGRISVLDQQRHMRRIDSCGSLDSHSHRYFSGGENQRHHLPPNAAQFRPITAVRVSIDDDEDTGYEVLNRSRCGSAGSHASRGSRERGRGGRGERRTSQSPSRSDTSPRNPSPLCMESTTTTTPSAAGNYQQLQLSAPPHGSSTVALTTSPDYIIQQQDHSLALAASDCQFRPIPVNETRSRPRTSSGGERYMSKTPSSSSITRPSSTTPGSRHRINSRGSGGEPCEPKIMSPLSPTRKVPQSFKVIAGDIHKLPSRCDPAPPQTQAQMELIFARSESLV